MKIFTVLAASNQSFLAVECLGKVSYKLVPRVLMLAQEFKRAAPELSRAYEEQTGQASADWDELDESVAPLTSVFELLRSWAVPLLPQN